MSARVQGIAALAALVLVGVIVGCHGGDGAKVSGTAPLVPTAQAGLRGDLNGNGTPDVSDAIGILRIVVGLDPGDPLADCDQNGSTGVGDAIMLLRCIVGLGEWPILPGEHNLGDEMTGPDGQTLVWVPGGSFMMGTDTPHPDGLDDCLPIHQVTLDGFWMGRCEVTNDQYAAFLNAAQFVDVANWIRLDSLRGGIELTQAGYQAQAGRGGHPVAGIFWYGAVAYCEHYGYTLPTEAQWEYAAAGPDARDYPWGDTWDSSNCCSVVDDPYAYSDTAPVGSFPAYYADYYSISPELNPTGPADGQDRVLRGGSYSSNMLFELLCASRGGQEPTSEWVHTVGFRVAMGSPGW